MVFLQRICVAGGSTNVGSRPIADARNAFTNVCLDSNVAATNPVGHLLIFWRRGTDEFVKSLRVPNPRGVATSLNRREILLTFGQAAKVCRLDAATLAAVDVPGNRDGVVCEITGSYITVHETDAVA